jgi:hypothetical protein
MGEIRLTLTDQVERYVELGFPAAAGRSEDDFRALAAPFIGGDDAAAYEGATGRIGALLIVRRSVVPVAEAMSRLEVEGKRGFVDMNPSAPDAFAEIDGVDLPDAEVYVLHDFDPGDDMRDEPPSTALEEIRRRGRSPLTIDEGVCAAVLFPQLVADKHAFSLLASRSDEQKVKNSVPAIWISRGAPRLGWCWNNNPHSWLGSASCLLRSV